MNQSHSTGAVSAATSEAREVGMKILASGGNAFDAIIATAIVLAVVEPGNSGLGGEGYCIFYDSEKAETGSLCFMEVPGGLATPENLSGKDLLRGVMAPMIPGMVAGWYALISEKCSLSAEELLAPAIDYAENGFELCAHEAGGLNWMKEYFHPSAHSVFVRPDRPWQSGDRLYQPELAQTLKHIARDGAEFFYVGDFAEKMDRFLHDSGGILRKSDLASYKPIWQGTLSRRFGDFEIHVPPPESTGFELLYGLELLSRLNYGSLKPGELDAARSIASVSRKMQECIDDMLSKMLPYDPNVDEAIAGLFEEEALQKAVNSLHSKHFVHYPSHGFHTTSLSACDSFGNYICLTQTLDHGYGSGVVIPGTGVLMNNGMAWMNADNPTRADIVAPFGHYFAPVIPTLVLDVSGKPIIALGTPGGNGIPQTTMQVYANMLFHNDDVEKALSRPRIFLGAIVPETPAEGISLEPGFAPEVYSELQIEESDIYRYFGDFHAVGRNHKGGFTAYDDPRGINARSS